MQKLRPDRFQWGDIMGEGPEARRRDVRAHQPIIQNYAVTMMYVAPVEHVGQHRGKKTSNRTYRQRGSGSDRRATKDSALRCPAPAPPAWSFQHARAAVVWNLQPSCGQHFGSSISSSDPPFLMGGARSLRGRVRCTPRSFSVASAMGTCRAQRATESDICVGGPCCRRRMPALARRACLVADPTIAVPASHICRSLHDDGRAMAMCARRVWRRVIAELTILLHSRPIQRHSASWQRCFETLSRSQNNPACRG